jgi:hypothetical protein
MPRFARRWLECCFEILLVESAATAEINRTTRARPHDTLWNLCNLHNYLHCVFDPVEGLLIFSPPAGLRPVTQAAVLIWCINLLV